MIVITNNVMIKENRDKLNILMLEKDYIEILKTCRDYIHKGYELLSHPLYGSVKPNETPYRSIILKKSNNLDTNSVTLIEEAICVATKFTNNSKTPNWTERVLDDFRVIDYDIFSNTIERIEYI